MLTPKQHACLTLIDAHIARTGRSPSYKEIAARLGPCSGARVWRLVTDLVERGFLKRVPARHHGLEVIRRPCGPQQELLDACRRLISSDSGYDHEFFEAWEAMKRVVARAEREVS